MNAFDRLGILQKKARIEADNYSFFIHAGFVTDIDELKKLYIWFDSDWSIRDPKGRTRLKILKKLPDWAAWQVINLRNVEYQERPLRKYIKERMITNGNNAGGNHGN
jgi:hypothetical protein